MPPGTALASAVTAAGTELEDLMLTGLVAGAAVAAAQSTLLARAGLARAAWAAVTAASWPVGWLATWATIVDVERRYYIFGASGALLVTVPHRPGAATRVRLAGRDQRHGAARRAREP
jgi:hypothetical protein